jgi:hypothetical protein
MDLAPALLELLGVVPDPEMAGISLLEGGSRGPILSSTFGGGPLRWAWRDGARKVILRMGAQHDLGAVASTAMREGAPLPAGAYFFDLEEDRGEESPAPIPGEILGGVGAAFAASAGSLVPGLQLLVWAERGPVEVVLEVPENGEIVQAWSTGTMAVTRRGGRLEVSCKQGFPLCALATAFEARPEWIAPREVTSTWQGVAAEARIAPESLQPPPEWLVQGAYLWWNPERTRVVRGHAATLERLRALGYLE